MPGRPRSAPGSMSKSHRASIISRALFMRVAGVDRDFFAPSTRSDGQGRLQRSLSASCSQVRLRNGPPLAVKIRRRTSLWPPACNAWNTALCSLSTGRIVVPFFLGQLHDQRPGDDEAFSLLASAIFLPASSAAQVPRRPTLPTIADTTVSISGSTTDWAMASARRGVCTPAANPTQFCFSAALRSVTTT